MSVIITGASGLLGRALLKVFDDADAWTSVIGTAMSRAKGRLAKVDLTSKDAINTLLDEKVNVVIHAAAERRPDQIENAPGKAKDLNVNATAALAKACAERNIWLLYISTDYVFDGTSPPYAEDATPNPLNAYGVTKMEGERECLELCKTAAVLRVPILYGSVETLAESAVTIIATSLMELKQNLIQSDTVNVDIDDHNQRFPTHVEDVASVVVQMANKVLSKTDNIQGIFHYSGSEQMTKYSMAQAMAEVVDVPVEHIKQAHHDINASTSRPGNSQLSCDRLKQAGITFPVRSFKTSISDVIKPHLN